jgi:type IV secretory pathway VirB4 component
MAKLKSAGSDITCDKEAMPTLNDLYNELLVQPEPEAHTMASILEVYAQGSFATFAHRSNIETDKNFVVYNIRNLGTGMKDLGLHVCLNDIWNKMIENRKKGLWTWIYIDEFYLLLQSDSAAKFLMQVWKRARKWHGVPTGIMQNTEDLLRSADSRNIINNTSFVMMLSLPKLDRTNLGDLLQIPDSQLEYITNGEPGQGLMYTGKTLLPFTNIMPSDTELYRLMTTKADE